MGQPGQFVRTNGRFRKRDGRFLKYDADGNCDQCCDDAECCRCSDYTGDSSALSVTGQISESVPNNSSETVQGVSLQLCFEELANSTRSLRRIGSVNASVDYFANTDSIRVGLSTLSIDAQLQRSFGNTYSAEVSIRQSGGTLDAASMVIDPQTTYDIVGSFDLLIATTLGDVEPADEPCEFCIEGTSRVVTNATISISNPSVGTATANVSTDVTSPIKFVHQYGQQGFHVFNSNSFNLDLNTFPDPASTWSGTYEDGVEWSANLTATPLGLPPCTEQRGCCVPAGGCQNMTVAECMAAGGTVLSDQCTGPADARCVSPMSFVRSGPGTELQQMLATWGVRSCDRCNATARKMNEAGAEWCKDNLPSLVDEIHNNAKRHKSVHGAFVRAASMVGGNQTVRQQIAKMVQQAIFRAASKRE